MIHLSETAIAEINRRKAYHSSHQPQLLFRLSVQRGGCSDWIYTMGLDEAIAPDDQVFVCSTVQVVIDTKSLQYLDGVAVDYTEDLMGGGFQFKNPHAASHCGCGNSFTLA
jgi:iron-sulfur cluster assembly protein